MKFQHMNKPKVRTDIKQVLFYRGYWVLDYGNGYYSYGENIGYAPAEKVIDNINHRVSVADVVADIVKLKGEQEKALARHKAVQELIMEKERLLKRLGESDNETI